MSSTMGMPLGPGMKVEDIFSDCSRFSEMGSGLSKVQPLKGMCAVFLRYSEILVRALSYCQSFLNGLYQKQKKPLSLLIAACLDAFEAPGLKQLFIHAGRCIMFCPFGGAPLRWEVRVSDQSLLTLLPMMSILPLFLYLSRQKRRFCENSLKA